jgi:hypothetical protein
MHARTHHLSFLLVAESKLASIKRAMDKKNVLLSRL